MFNSGQPLSEWFLGPGASPADALAGHYSPALVLFSILVAVLASYAAYMVTERIREASVGLHRLIWWLVGSVCMGVGIWTMHFVGMTALTLPVPVNYDPLTTILSIVPAIVAGSIIVSPREGSATSSFRFLLYSLVVGIGITAMHYIGMEAMQLSASMRHDPVIFGLSVIVAIAGSALSLQSKTWIKNTDFTTAAPDRSQIGAALVMGLAISATHYFAMQGTNFFKSSAVQPSGLEWPQEFLANAIGFSTGAILVMLISAIHLSRRLELVSMLAASEIRLQATLNSVAEGIVTIDSRGQIATFNRGAESIFLYSADEVIGRNVSVLVPRNMRSEHEGYTRDSKLSSTRVIDKVRDLEGLKKDGSLFPLELSVTPMKEHGQTSFIGVMRDISERKKHEENLLKAMEQAELGNRAKSDFLASMSHELRTPLNAIQGFAQFLKYDPKNSLNEEQTSRVDLIIKGGDFLLELVKQVLELSTIESGKLSLTIDHISPRLVIDDCLAMVRLRAADNDIEIIDQTSMTNPPLLWTDETRLKQALLNLLSNAVKYNDPGGKVTISSERQENTMFRISVTDTGPGIAKEQQDKLFEPFERLGREAGRIEGTGIGLSITKKIVEVLGGHIGFTSEPGTGSTFWIDIPMIEGTDTVAENFQAAETPDGTTGTVLFIEDNPENIKSMEIIIGRLNSLKLVIAHKWELCSDLAREHRPVLIITDVDRPGSNVFECLNECRKDGDANAPPILAVTAVSSPKDIENGIKAGFTDYLVKPFDVEKSVAIIDEILGLEP